MTLIEALNIVLYDMEFGECRAISKEDIKFRAYELTGHYPRHMEFERDFEKIRVPVNKYDLVYKPNVGWYRAGKWGLNEYKKRLNQQIQKREQLKKAIR